jgi:hypothetical protein
MVTVTGIVVCSYEGMYVLNDSVTAMNVWWEWERVRWRRCDLVRARLCGRALVLDAVDMMCDGVAVLHALGTTGDDARMCVEDSACVRGRQTT